MTYTQQFSSFRERSHISELEKLVASLAMNLNLIFPPRTLCSRPRISSMLACPPCLVAYFKASASPYLKVPIVCSEAYVKAFQYKVLNFILYTNTKLYKIGYITDDKCSFCKFEPETLLHLLFNCVYSKLFWKDFEFYFYSLSKEFVHLSLQDVLIGIISSECPLLNYFLLIAKLFLWDCRRSQILPSLAGFKRKIKIKFETEKYICTKNNTLDKFIKKWGTVCPL